MNHSRTRGQAAGRAPESEGALDQGLVVAAYGRHCLVESPDGQRRICHPRGKKSQAVVGDRVRWMPTGDEGSIERVESRRNLFYRQDELRTKSFAANLDQVLLLLAAEPEFSESQLKILGRYVTNTSSNIFVLSIKQLLTKTPFCAHHPRITKRQAFCNPTWFPFPANHRLRQRRTLQHVRKQP